MSSTIKGDWRDVPLTLSFMQSKFGNASNDSYTPRALIERKFAAHAVGDDKDSFGFSGASLINDTPGNHDGKAGVSGKPGKNFTNANVSAVSLLLFDFDGNLHYTEAVRPLKEAGLAFVGYSSFNHGKTDDAGNPVEKFRLVLFIDAPCTLAVGDQQAVRAKAFALAYMSVAKHFGWPVLDKSCRNAAHLFYLPRHNGSEAAKQNAFIDVVDGEPFDFAPFFNASLAHLEAEQAKTAKQKADREAKRSAKLERKATFDTTWIWRFRQYSSFDLKGWAADTLDGAVSTGTGAVELPCPNDENHATNPGDGRRVLFLYNAGDPNDKGGVHDAPFAHCNHGTCNLGTWGYVDLLAQQNGIDEPPLEYLSGPDREDYEGNEDLPFGFRRRGDWIEVHLPDKDEWARVCGDFTVGAHVRDESGEGPGTEIHFVSGKVQTSAIVRKADLQKDIGEICAGLVQKGLPITTRASLRAHAIELFNRLESTETLTLYSRPGWHGGAFVTSLGEVIGGNGRLDPARAAPVHAPGGDRASYSGVLGDLADSRLYHWQLGVMIGCAGPFLSLLGLDSLQLYIGGASGRGKTTSQMLQTSVWGSPEKGQGLLFPCKATVNGLEGLLGRGHGQTTALDELRQMDERSRRDLIFNLATGQSKTRMSRNLDVRKSWTWHQIITISGEQSPAHLFGGERGRIAGEVVRMPSIDVGCIEPLDDPRFAEQVGQAVKLNHGWLGPDVVRLIIGKGWHVDASALRAIYDGKHAALLQGSYRAADYRSSALFTLLWTVGELLQGAQLLPATWRVEAAVKWAHGTFVDSDDVANMDPMAAARDALIAYIRANPSKFPKAGSVGAEHSGHSGFDGWTLEEGGEVTVCILVAAFDRIVGGTTTGGAFKAWLSREGLLLKQGKNDLWTYLPGVGDGVRHYRIVIGREETAGVQPGTLARLAASQVAH